MYKFDLENYSCKTREEFIKLGYEIIENNNGSVSLFTKEGKNLTSQIETKPCCEALGYTFDIDTQTCNWGVARTTAASCDSPFKVMLNPNGNDGVLFNVEENETCSLDVSFDYMFKFDCDTLANVNRGTVSKETTEVVTKIGSEIKELTEYKFKLEQEITYLTKELSNLPNVPFVIECTEFASSTEAAKNLYNKSATEKEVQARNEEIFNNPDQLNSTFYKADSAEEARKALEEAIRKANGGLPPSAFAAQSTRRLCISSQEGLSLWRTIIGQEDYNNWLSADGAIVNYSCDEFNKFESNGTNGVEYDTDCNWALTDRAKVQKQAAEYKEVITKLTKELEEVCSKIEVLTEEKAKVIESSSVSGGVCANPIEVFENLTVFYTVEVRRNGQWESVYGDKLIDIGQGNLYDYLVDNHTNSGIMISGFSECTESYEVPSAPTGNPIETPLTEEEKKKAEEEAKAKAEAEAKAKVEAAEAARKEAQSKLPPTAFDLRSNTANSEDCTYVATAIYEGLYEQYVNKFGATAGSQAELDNFEQFASCWYRGTCWRGLSVTIPQELVDVDIKNEDINISFTVVSSCADFSIMVDRVKLNKRCEKVDNVETFISEPPKFEISRVADNKKSWHAKDEREARDFDLKYRPTEYDINHHKLAINTKEVDLNLDPARAVEQDLWCYVNNNSSLLGCKTGATFSCPSGTTIAPGLDDCFTLSSTTATLNGTPFTGYGGNNLTNYTEFGTSFYENIDDLELPLSTSATIGANGMFDGTGGTVTEVIRVNTGTFWHSTGTSNGKLNVNGIWGTPSSGSNLPFNEWIGFTQCIELSETKTYYVGIGADNRCRFSVNGTRYVEFDNSNDRNFKLWHVFPITLNSGLNIIEMQGWNDSSQAAFGAEIYDPESLEALTASTSSGTTGLIFSTANMIGEEFILGNSNGYSCPTGYALNNCSGGTPVCTAINRFGISGETDCVCCPGQSILAAPLVSEGTLEFDVNNFVYNFERGSEDFNVQVKSACNDIDELVSEIAGGGDPNRLKEVDTFNDCGRVFAASGDTSGGVEIDGNLFVFENDGTLGVYEYYKETGNDLQYGNLSNLSTSCFCNGLNNLFEAYEFVYGQETESFPRVTWDENRERCVYSRCGDNCNSLSGTMSTDLSEIDSLTEFNNAVYSELIDTKNRQVISSYPTLKLLYERYSSESLTFAPFRSNEFNYSDMDAIGQSIDNYWIDLIEQFVPATTIWGSTYTYRNTIFDEQKYKYRNSNTYFIDNPSKDFQKDPIASDNTVSVEVSVVPRPDIEEVTSVPDRTGGEVFIMEYQCSPEFLGKVTSSANQSSNYLGESKT